ncbi:MAG: hypothetical protein EP343_00150 [Deltaproteobacteria bacterium]|nr:MAG: hypothetical protein EP343_00150 [Deltaproteobacteria bacterium]
MTTYKGPQADKAKTMNPQRNTLIPWEETSGIELSLLQRVESQVLDFHDQSQEAQTAASGPQPPPSLTHGWLWPTMAAGFAVCLLFVWTLRTPEAPLPALQAEGTLKLVTAQNSHAKTQEVRTELQTNATLKDPQGWELRSHTTTQLRIRRGAPKESVVALQEGAASFHVVPGAMKTFVVQCPEQLQVVVKGTKFLVWHVGRGTRVEVTRGHVLLRQRNKERLHLYKGQGAFVPSDRSKPWQTYNVTDKSNDWMGKVEALATQKPALLQAYVQDLQDHKLLKPNERSQALEAAAHALQGQKKYAAAAKLWFRLSRLQSHAIAKQTALFQAAQSCRQSGHNLRRCVRWYKRVEHRFPRGLPSLREASLYWQGALLHKMGPTHTKEAIDSLQRYLRSYPSGSYAKQARPLKQSLSTKR